MKKTLLIILVLFQVNAAISQLVFKTDQIIVSEWKKGTWKDIDKQENYVDFTVQHKTIMATDKNKSVYTIIEELKEKPTEGIITLAYKVRDDDGVICHFTLIKRKDTGEASILIMYTDYLFDYHIYKTINN